MPPRRRHARGEVGVLAGAIVVTLAVLLLPWYRIELDYGDYGGVVQHELRGLDHGLLGVYEIAACWIAAGWAALRSHKRARTTSFRWGALLLCSAALALCVVDIRDFSYVNFMVTPKVSKDIGPYVAAGGAVIGMISAIALLGATTAGPDDDRAAELRRVFD